MSNTVTVHHECDEEYYASFWVVESRQSSQDDYLKVLVFENDTPDKGRAIADKIADLLRNL